MRKPKIPKSNGSAFDKFDAEAVCLPRRSASKGELGAFLAEPILMHLTREKGIKRSMWNEALHCDSSDSALCRQIRVVSAAWEIHQGLDRGKNARKCSGD
jgi:hypothetical protein